MGRQGRLCGDHGGRLCGGLARHHVVDVYPPFASIGEFNLVPILLLCHSHVASSRRNLGHHLVCHPWSGSHFNTEVCGWGSWGGVVCDGIPEWLPTALSWTEPGGIIPAVAAVEQKVDKLRTTVPCVILAPQTVIVYCPTVCVVSMSQCLAWNREGIAAGRAHGDAPRLGDTAVLISHRICRCARIHIGSSIRYRPSNGDGDHLAVRWPQSCGVSLDGEDRWALVDLHRQRLWCLLVLSIIRGHVCEDRAFPPPKSSLWYCSRPPPAFHDLPLREQIGFLLHPDPTCVINSG